MERAPLSVHTNHYYDEQFPEHERLHRQFTILFQQQWQDDQYVTFMKHGDDPFGARLKDQCASDDGYRFHDAFHLAFASHLAWSPVVRSALNGKRADGCFGRQRKSIPRVYEAQDAGRAKIIEETVVALIFDYGRDHNFLREGSPIQPYLLNQIKRLTRFLEVSDRGPGEWETAIRAGFRTWDQLRAHGGGTVFCDLSKQEIHFTAP